MKEQSRKIEKETESTKIENEIESTMTENATFPYKTALPESGRIYLSIPPENI